MSLEARLHTEVQIALGIRNLITPTGGAVSPV
jgi:hypothetical protein